MTDGLGVTVALKKYFTLSCTSLYFYCPYAESGPAPGVPGGGERGRSEQRGAAGDGAGQPGARRRDGRRSALPQAEKPKPCDDREGADDLFISLIYLVEGKWNSEPHKLQFQFIFCTRVSFQHK